ncbi:hypothetical protein [Geoalkalibacter subterraneus]|uniref:Uncharacterized protein n=1 Tax=Geoalkalibacter subterraneus TaxID=483547 RepID=A0A0B5FJC0_9BACT|nr:hypothetical protein [Geoalkalibacter subterraneus]AJF08267.1 hypothetical protein GSUB_17470 [Geoalkalibacter subterraneus]
MQETVMAPGVALDGTGRPVQVLSKGRVRFLTKVELEEIPLNCWHKYCQHRLSMSHEQAISKFGRNTV